MSHDNGVRSGNVDQPLDETTVLDTVRCWLDTFVVGLELCPFAGAPLRAGRVRIVVTPAQSLETLLASLCEEIGRLDDHPEIETTLLVHPQVLQSFEAYNQALDLVDALLADSGHEGVYQVASFHPDYRFAGTDADDAGNYTNRSPFPMLHLLREESVEQAASAMDTDRIPARNVELMNRMGRDTLRRRLAACRKDP